MPGLFKSKKFYIILSSVIVVCLIAWGAFWLGTRKNNNSDASNVSNTSSVSDEQTSPSTSGGLSVQNSSSGATNLGQLGASSSSQNGISTSGGGGTTSSTTGSNSSPSSSSSSPTDPSNFAQYNQYLNSQTTYFGDITAGTGAALANGQTAVITYKGWLTNGTLFDESQEEANGQLQPLSFTIGQHQVISGMEEGTLGMKVGGTRLIIIPPVLGYGASGKGSIPGNSVLVFEVNLLDVQ